jgi:dipeptidase D
VSAPDGPYAGLEPAALWRHFARLNAIARPSGHEAAARSYVQDVAERAGAIYRVDARGNTVVFLPGVGAGSGAPPVAVQAHLDMVCESRSGIRHDVLNDPVRPRCEGDWIYATGTTLGADNGIGVAACLSLMSESGLRHGPLELIFTVEEETGLHGALALDTSMIESRLLINLDSEDPGGVTIGGAGGASVFCRLPARREEPPAGSMGLEVRISGLRGGHSGIQIHERLANAIKLLGEALSSVKVAGIPFQLASIEGGSAHNAIPRDASARLLINPELLPRLHAVLGTVAEGLRVEWAEAEPGLSLGHDEARVQKGALSAEQEDLLLRLLRHLPHGALEMSPHFPGTVQTSANLARARTEDGEVELLVSIRSLLQNKLEALGAEIRSFVASSGGSVTIRDVYPGWEPNPSSRLLQLTEKKYREVYGRPPEIQVIHGGLECGVIASRIHGMDAISFGPLIRNPHSPDEGVLSSTVLPTWKLLTSLLDALAD